MLLFQAPPHTHTWRFEISTRTAAIPNWMPFILNVDFCRNRHVRESHCNHVKTHFKKKLKEPRKGAGAFFFLATDARWTAYWSEWAAPCVRHWGIAWKSLAWNFQRHTKCVRISLLPLIQERSFRTEDCLKNIRFFPSWHRRRRVAGQMANFL